MDDDKRVQLRWGLLQLSRTVSLILVLAGVYTLAERGLDRPAPGYVMLLIGAVLFFALPIFLARKWKSR